MRTSYLLFVSILLNTHVALAKPSQTVAQDTTTANAFFKQALDYQKAANFDSSTLFFEKALDLYVTARMTSKVVEAHAEIGLNLWRKREYDAAKNRLQTALDLAEKESITNQILVAQTLHYMGLTHYSTGKYNDAIGYYEKSLAIRQKELGELHYDVSRSYNNIGASYMYLANFPKALEYIKKAMEIRRELLGEDHINIASSYNNISLIYQNLGDFDQSRAYQQRALAIREKALPPDHPSLAQSYQNLGYAAYLNGDYETSIEHSQKSLEIYLKHEGEKGLNVASLFRNLSNAFWRKGELGVALDYVKRALAIREEVLGPEHHHTGVDFLNLGNILLFLGREDEGFAAYYKALDILKKAFGERHADVSLQYNNLGYVLANKGRFKEAADYHEKALDIRREVFGEKHPDTGQSYGNLGDLYSIMGEFGKAHEFLDKSAAVFQPLYGEHHPELAELYEVKARTYLKQEQFDSALQFVQKSIKSVVSDYDIENTHAQPRLDNVLSQPELFDALATKAEILSTLAESGRTSGENSQTALQAYERLAALVEQMRRGYKTEETSLVLSEKSHGVFQKAFDVALQLAPETGDGGFYKKAWFFAEKSKAGVLQDALLESNARRFSGIPDSLLRQENLLRGGLIFQDTELQKERARGANADSLKTANLEKKLFDLKRKYQALQDRFEAEFPKYHALKFQDSAIDLETMQQYLAPDQLLIEYFFSEKSLTIFLLSQSDFQLRTVPVGESLQKNIKAFLAAIKKLDTPGFLNANRKLYDTLISPIQSELDKYSRLVIIPDGVLYYLPFEALFRPSESADDARPDFTKLPWLIRSHSIVYHYSANLFFSEKINASRQKAIADNAAPSFVGFAPVFSDTAQVGAIEETATTSVLLTDDSPALRSIIVDGKRFQALEHSEKEVRGAMQLFEKKRRQGMAFYHGKATESNFKSSLAQRRFVHIATHGILNEENPKLSGLLFAPEGNDGGEDGVLYASETFNLDLDADLVVLSSCESGLGQYVKGEGLMALTRGFLYAGASNVLVSLWKVYDRHTKTLMVDFYKNALSGDSYAEALRQAKLKMIKKPATAFPSKWSAFVLIGR